MNKKLVLVSLAFIFFQSIIIHAEVITGYTTKVWKYVTFYPTKSNPTSTTTDYINPGISEAQVGINYTEGTNPPCQRDNYARSRDHFTIYLAENEVISSATISVTTSYTSGSGSFNITYISNPTATTDPGIYDETASGSSVGIMSYNGGTQNFNVTSIMANQVGGKSYTFGFSEGGYGFATLSITLTITKSTLPSVTVYVQNNFSGGNVKAAANNSTPPQVSAPATISSYATKTVYIGAVEPQNSGDGYYRVFNDTEAPSNKSQWNECFQSGAIIGKISDYPNTNFQLNSSMNNHICRAEMRKLCNVIFQTSGVGIGNNHGTITITNGPSGTSPVTGSIVEANSITATFPLNFWYNDIFYQVVDGQTVTRTPDGHETVTKQYTGIPNWPSSTPRNLTLSSIKVDNQFYVKLTWNEHPNTNVTRYDITRQVQGEGSSYVIASVNRGTTTFTDYGFLWKAEGTGIDLAYNVRAYYSVESSTSWDSYVYCDGEDVRQQQKRTVSKDNLDYSISSFPNPFNPTTRIEYQLPQSGYVTLKVYNSLGKEIATLVNERMEEGKYQVEFNGSDQPSGIYFCQYQVNDYVQTMKMLMVK